MNPYQPEGENEWHGLYRGDTSRDRFLFTPDSVRHPAKMSNHLLRRIIEQMQEWGWLKTGDCLVDPFGGTGRTALYWCALHPENRGATVEIEPHFVEMQRANKDHAEAKLGRPLRWEILQGDSRQCDRLLNEGGLVLTSPPYGDITPGIAQSAENKAGGLGAAYREGRLSAVQSVHYGKTPGQIGTLPDVAITSPPYGQGTIGKGHVDAEKMIARTPSLAGRDPNGAWFQALANGYHNSEPGNIDNLGDAAITSPPYEGDQPCQSQSRVLKEQGYEGFKRGNHKRDPHLANQVGVTSPPYEAQRAEPNYSEERRGKMSGPCADRRDAHRAHETGGYSAVTSPPYEGTLASGDPDEKGGLFRDPKRRNDRTLTNGYSVVTSPPYEAQNGGKGKGVCAEGPLSDPRLHDRHAASKINPDAGYADNEHGQIGATQGETYADACLAVYSACARAGIRYLAVVTKDPTRDGKLRRIGKLTCRLLRESGYRVVAWRAAILFETEEQMEKRGAHTPALFEEFDTPGKVRGRLSFFKRLHLAKGRVAAQHEDVFFCELVDRLPGPSRSVSTHDRPSIDADLATIDAGPGRSPSLALGDPR